MSDLGDLTEAVEAASAALMGPGWDDLEPMEKFRIRSIMLPIAAAVVPVVKRQLALQNLRFQLDE